MNVAPAPGWLSTVIVPDALATIDCAVASPRPMPSPTGLVEKNGSNTRGRSAAGMPTPVSLIANDVVAPSLHTRTRTR